MALQQNVATAVQAGTHAHLAQVTAAQITGLQNEPYMGEANKRCFRSLLVVLEQLLADRLKSDAAEIAIGSAGADPIDRASAEEEHQTAIAARARDAAQLLEVRAALRRLDADEFGWCDETGDMIGIGRLLVCPTTTLCVDAQQRRETKSSRFRG